MTEDHHARVQEIVHYLNEAGFGAAFDRVYIAQCFTEKAEEAIEEVEEAVAAGRCKSPHGLLKKLLGPLAVKPDDRPGRLKRDRERKQAVSKFLERL
tara:strand:+ start:320 stop:610 length:291 start_codon:yes stop_codon:yes gene_type:complete